MGEDPASAEQRLDEIVTQWSLLRLAHLGASLESTDARRRMLLKYNRAIRDYARALLQNESDADEVAQDILVRMLRGDFANANPEKGKFRHFVKAAVRNLVRTNWSQKQRHPVSVTDLQQVDIPNGLSTANPVSVEPETDVTWKTTVLQLTMRALEEFQTAHPGCLYYSALKLRQDFPDEDMESLSRRLGDAASRKLTAANMRQLLHRARLRYAQLLIEEVASSLTTVTADSVEEELAELGLLEFVRPFLSSSWRNDGTLSGN